MSCFVVIVSYNGMKWINACLSSIPNSYKIIVVDNNSTDGTVEFIKSNFPHVYLMELQENLGFGQANNKGISYALQQDAQSVFLLNQDAYIVDDALEKLLNIQKRHPEFGILSPIHINANKSNLDANFSKYIAPPNSYSFYSDFVLKQKLEEIYPVPFVNAAAWLLSRECLEKVGGFDPLFYHYGEDDNYCQRVRYHGFKIGVLPDTFVIHDRESRPNKEIRLGTAAYYEKLMLKYKVICADINNEVGLEILKKRIYKLSLYFIAAISTFQFKESKRFYKEIRSLKKIKSKIQMSRDTNYKVHANYLQLK